MNPTREEYLQKIVDSFPPFTAAQQDALRYFFMATDTNAGGDVVAGS